MGDILASNSTRENVGDLPTAESLSSNGWLLFRATVHAILFLVGAPGNCLILRVYWTKTRKTSTHVLIMALAWADLGVSLLRVHAVAQYALRFAGEQIPAIVNIIWVVETTLIVTSCVITTAIAADRYDCICRPHRRFFTCKRGKIAAWTALLFSLIACTPNLISGLTAYQYATLNILFTALETGCIMAASVMIVAFYGKVYTTIRKHVQVNAVFATTLQSKNCLVNRRGSTQPLPYKPVVRESHTLAVDKDVSTSIHQPSTSSIDYATSSRRSHLASDASTSSQVVPGSLQGETWDKSGTQTKPGKQIVTSETVDLCAIRGNKTSRQEPGTAAEPAPKRVGGAALQRKTTRMLFITSVVFLLTWLPYWIYAVLSFVVYDGKSVHPTVQDVTDELNILPYINNAVNPLIYGLANRRFRKDCREVLSTIGPC